MVPVYHGQFRVVQADVVLADVAAQVAAGAEHITFGDPDFFNGPTHALRIVEALHAAHPALTYDVTIKVEHLLGHRELLPRLRDTGCLFVTSAIESLDDRVLALLEKGHTRRDFFEAVALCRAGGLTIVPTFVAFHPWLSLEGYCDLLDVLADLDLVRHVAPIQLAIRLLIPEGSRLLELEEVRRLVGAFDPEHADVSMVPSRSASGPSPRAGGLHGRRESGLRPRGLVRRDLGARLPECRAGPARAASGSRSRNGSVSQRTLVLLSGAESGAGGSGLERVSSQLTVHS